jgi:hypothetical protein
LIPAKKYSIFNFSSNFITPIYLRQNDLTVSHGFGCVIIYTGVKLGLSLCGKRKIMWEFTNNVFGMAN